METFSKWIIGWIFVMIPGFIYMIGILCLIQYNPKYKLFNYIKTYKSFFPYIFISLVLFSYIIGLSAHYSFEQIYHWFFEKEKLPPVHSDYYQFYIDLSYYYQYLVMWRHLFISTLFLFLILLLPKYRDFVKWPIWLFFIMAIIVVLLCYLDFREILNKIVPDNPMYKTQQGLNYH